MTYPFTFICKIICKKCNKYELDKFYHLIILQNISLKIEKIICKNFNRLKRLLIELLIIK